MSSSAQPGGPEAPVGPGGVRGGRRGGGRNPGSGGRGPGGRGTEGGPPSTSWSDVVAKKATDSVPREQPESAPAPDAPYASMSFGTIGMDEPIPQVPAPIVMAHKQGPPPQHQPQQRGPAPGGMKLAGPPQPQHAPPMGVMPAGMVPQPGGMPAAPPGLVPPHMAGGPPHVQPPMMVPAGVMAAMPGIPMVPPQMQGVPPPPGMVPPAAAGKGPMGPGGMPMAPMQGKPQGPGGPGAPPPPPPRTGSAPQQQPPVLAPQQQHAGGGKPYVQQVQQQQPGAPAPQQQQQVQHMHTPDGQQAGAQQGRRGGTPHGAQQRGGVYNQAGGKMGGGQQQGQAGGYQQVSQAQMQQGQAQAAAQAQQQQQYAAQGYGFGYFNAAPQAAFAAYPVQMYPATGYAGAYGYTPQQAAPYMQVAAQGYPQQAVASTPAAPSMGGGGVVSGQGAGAAASPATTPGVPASAGRGREMPKASSPSVAPATPPSQVLFTPKTSKRIAIVNPNTKEEVKVEAPTAGAPRAAADKQAAPTPAAAAPLRPKPPAIVPPAPPATAAAANVGVSTPSKEIMAMAQQQQQQQQRVAATAQPPAPAAPAAEAGKPSAVPVQPAAAEQPTAPAEAAAAAALVSEPVAAADAAAADTGAAPAEDAAEAAVEAERASSGVEGEERPKVRTLIKSFAEAIAKSSGPSSPRGVGSKSSGPSSPRTNGPPPPRGPPLTAAAPVASSPEAEPAAEAEAATTAASAAIAAATAAKKQLSRKEVLAKADAKGPQGDMLETFRPQPAEAKEAEAPAAPLTPPPGEEAAPAAAPSSSAEPEGPAVGDNWEDEADAEQGAAAAAPEVSQAAKGSAPPAGPAVSPFADVAADDGRRQYTRDYIIKLRDLAACRVKPTLTTEIDEIINDPNAPGYIPAAGGFERALSRGDSRGGGGRRGGPERADIDWGARGGRGGGPPVPSVGGFRDGPRASAGGGPGMMRADSGRRGGPPPGGVDADRWARGGPLPPARGAAPPRRDLPALHKSESAFKVGLVLSDDPQEEAKQKAFKGILNKLTPDNFERLTLQLLDVGITEAKTLVGLIGQVFDKALFEPHFCELYSQLCHTLQKRMPEFEDPEEEQPPPPSDGGAEVKRRKLNFRRLLLNKCQEEFEKGDAAMNAVAQREAKAKERGSKDDEAEGGDEEEQQQEEQQQQQTESEGGAAKEPAEGASGDVEEGETSPPKPAKPLDAKAAAAAARRAERLAAEEELKARRRMLGNIQFIGHLYRYGMLTENIMHSCIQRLLQDDQNPKLEDLECLCKLLSTIGQQLERGGLVKGSAGMSQSQLQAKQKEEAAKGRKLMDAYFARIQRLVENKALDSRLRFMLMDIQEQRQRGWQVRRKAEGPMKIEEVHRAAKREQDNVAARNDRGGGRGPPGRGPPGAAYGEMPRRPGGVDHLRRDELPTAPMKAQLGARTASTEISLRPQGFGLKGASPMRGAGERRPAATAVGTRMAPEQPPPPARTAQQPSQQQQREPALQQQRSGEEESSAPDSGRPSEAGGAALSEVEVHGHVESIVKLLFGQTDDTGETPQELLRAVVSNAEDVGGALQQLLRQCLDVRGVPLEERLEKPKAFMVQQLEEGGVLHDEHLTALFLGSSGFVARLSDLVEDVPKAPVLTGRMLGDFVAAGRLPLRAVCDAMLEDKPRGGGGSGSGDDGDGGDDEGGDPPLVDAEQALPLVVALLNRWREVAGDEGAAAHAAWAASGLEWKQLLPEFAREDADVSKALEKHGGSWLTHQ